MEKGMFGPRPKKRRLEFQEGDIVVKLLVSPDVAGKIIGTGGSEVKALREMTGVTLHIWESKFMATGLQVVVLGGPRASVEQGLLSVAQKLVDEAQKVGVDTISAPLLLTRNAVSKIIGGKGASITQLKQEFSCHLEAERDAHLGEQVMKVNGPSSMVPQLLVKLTEFVEGAGDSIEVANNEYAPAPGFAGGWPKGKDGKDGFGKGKEGKGGGFKGPFVGKGEKGPRPLSHGPAFPALGKGFGGQKGPGPGPYDGPQIEMDLLQAEQDPSVLSSVSTIQFAIPADAVSRVLGKGGFCSKEITRHTGAKLVIDPATPGQETCVVTLTGQVAGVNRAHCMIVSRLISQY